MIKLERIYIQNYKNIAEADLSLGNMNVIVGENGSGKTNLLGAIPLLNYIINGPINEVKDGFKMGGWFPSYEDEIWNKHLPYNKRTPIVLQLDFSNAETNILYSYTIHFENITDEIEFMGESGEIETGYSGETKISYEGLTYKNRTKTGKPILIFKRTQEEIVYGDGLKKGESIISYVDESTSVIRLLNLIKRSSRIAPEYTAALDVIELIFISNIYYLSSQRVVNKGNNVINRILSFDLNKEINSFMGSNNWIDYIQALSRILGISDIEVIDHREYDKNWGFSSRVMQNGLSKSLEELSDGSLVLLALITKIFSDSSDIFFIEEPENSIHPRALYELMKLIREKSLDKQFIITTHSPYLLNMIKPEEVLVAEKQEGGLSKIGKLPNVKAIQKKLKKSFMNFGDIVFAEPETDSDSE